MFTTIDSRPMTTRSQLDAKHTTSSQASNRAFAPFQRPAGSVRRSPPHASARIAHNAMQCFNTLTPGTWGAVGGIHRSTACQSSVERNYSVNVRCAAASFASASGASLSTEVVIVGGGLAGLAAGLALQKAGANAIKGSLLLNIHSAAAGRSKIPERKAQNPRSWCIYAVNSLVNRICSLDFFKQRIHMTGLSVRLYTRMVKDSSF